jgi:SAM-dependent methyltransferase
VSDPASTYRDDSVSPQMRFDEVETTMSHLFRRPHPALGGRTFGAALHDALLAKGMLGVPEVYELGGGAGFVGAAVSEAARKRGRPVRTTWLDLSLPLVRLQRQRLPEASALCAHAERLPLRDGAVRGLFLANEVIADLRVHPASSAESKLWAERLALPVDHAPLLNVGAFAFMAELSRVLAPGGCACLTEFGGDFGAAPVRLEGPLGKGRHVEHSIHFGHLERVAHAFGLEVERVLLADLLGIDRSMRVASYDDLMRLRRLVPKLPVLAYPRAELEAMHPVLTRIFRFEFPEIGSPRFPDPKSNGGFCQLFYALLLRK